MELIKNAFKLASKNIMLLCSLIIFYCLSSLYILLTKNASIAGNIQVILLYCLMIIAFFAGFFNIIKTVINKENTKMRFLEGVGEYFLPMFGIFVISFLFYLIASVIVTIAADKILGGVEPIIAFINKILNTPDTASAALQSASPDMLSNTLIFLISLWAALGVVSFLLIYWVPALYLSETKNILKSLLSAITTLVKKFFTTLLVFACVLVLAAIISTIEVLAASVPLVSAILDILNYYIIVVFLFAIFLFYKQTVK